MVVDAATFHRAAFFRIGNDDDFVGVNLEVGDKLDKVSDSEGIDGLRGNHLSLHVGPVDEAEALVGEGL